MSDSSTPARRSGGIPLALEASRVYLLASDVSAVFLGAEPRPALNEQFVDLTVLPGESKCVFVCECAARVLVMGLHAASAPPAWVPRCCPAFLWGFGVSRQLKNSPRSIVPRSEPWTGRQETRGMQEITVPRKELETRTGSL